ncbi:PREDICTED: polyadenylate-binding protein-interacting protein 2B isoform X1 [Nicrophorus vespilloides]|uniref:Polyadenylate-binding protein-interacting protein 2B isoform X1 n=1 Tax=Nicrophorus vespilloides TaxID=110193 RepID=A0ABM1NGY1_NICVS|nr:PREDICTED: polyadenylate-binding protein-interacting protein 2B isoform X1 [Nicrophorus vespilloides]XP_017786081.1 PREDICTED: polyadenylate-binding protein-interacting protein 2B isoform X1 [Nicrophorus vespilloides]
MKVPSNNMNGYSTYEEEHYFNEAGPPHNGTTNGTTNGNGTTSAPPAEETDFSEYMWMENEEEFDKEVLQRLEEEELMEQCMLQHMLDNENQTPAANTNNQNNANSKSDEEMAKSSTLNPHAAEFVPSWSRSNPKQPTEQKSS